MKVVHEICCGIDVHARMLVACLILANGEKEIRTFSTMTDDLLRLRDWLVAAQCTHVAIESTGVYWKPVFNILEDALTVILINPEHARALRGRKTDVKDAEWLADLLRHGLLKASFIPPPEIRELRELTRYRESLVRQQRTEAMAGRAATMNWSRHNLGIVATEAGCDWVIPYVDVINQSGGGSKAILVPLYNLVYHDAVIVSYGARDQQSLLRGILNGGVPELPITPTDEKTLSLMRQMMTLHKRVGLLEITRHEFLDANYRKERTTFADGTTATVDWDTNTFKINPAL